MGLIVRMGVSLNSDQVTQLLAMNLLRNRYRVEEGKGTVRGRDKSVTTDTFYRVWTENGRSLTVLECQGEGPFSTYSFEADFGAGGSTKFAESAFRALRMVGVELFDLGIDEKNAEAYRRVYHYWGPGDGLYAGSLLVKGVTAYALSHIFGDPDGIANGYRRCPNADCTDSRVTVNDTQDGHTWYCHGCHNAFD